MALQVMQDDVDRLEQQDVPLSLSKENVLMRDQPPRSSSNGNGIPTIRLVLITLDVLILIIISILGYWATDMTKRIKDQELAMQDMRTWRDTIRPVTEIDHVLVTQLSIETQKRAIMQEQTVVLVRDLKSMFDAMNAQQNTMHDALQRIEDRLMFNGSATKRK